MFAATSRTAFAVVSLVLLGMVPLASAAGGASKRDRVPPSPPANIHVVWASPSAVRTAWDAAVDNVGVVGYDVYKAGGRVRVSSPGFTMDGLACGESEPISVAAVDGAGNRSSRVSATVATAACPDVQPPSTPTGFTQLATTQTDVVLAWRASTDDVGVVGYGVWDGIVRVASTVDPTVTLSGLSCGSSRVYHVDAVDAAGNRSELGLAFVQTSACDDGQPPSAPTDLVATASTASTIAISWSASSDDDAVAGYRVFVDGAPVASVNQLTATVSNLACATSYTLAVDAYDAAGNHSPRTAVSAATAACATTPPSPPAGDTTPPSPPTNVAVSNATRSSISLTWTSSTDNVGVAGYGVYVNGSTASPTTQPGVSISDLACGTAYTVDVDAYDAAGNRSTKASVVGSTAPCADSEPPTAPVVVDTVRTATSIALSWAAASDNVGIAGYGLYRGGTLIGTTAATTTVFSGLTCDTSYMLAVDAYDAAANRSTKTIVMVSTNACPDTTPPSTPTNLAASSVSQAGLTLTWTASSDSVGVTGYDVYRNGTKMETATSTSSSQTGLACGTSYAFAVVARDAAGNSSAQAQLNASTSACSAPPSSSTITAGETSVLPLADSDNGNLLVAQQASVSQDGALQSLSFYVTAAAGKLRLGVYDASGPNGGPGSKLAETAELTPVVGWNTAAVVSPVSLAAGSYWLAYLPSSNGLGFRKVDQGQGGRYYAYAYGSMPGSFSTSPSSTPSQWSFYATLGVSGSAPPPPPPPSSPPPPSPPPPSSTTNCFASPGACGYPDPAAGNVGVPAGTTLTPSGSINVTTAGTVVDGKDVTGEITVSANNVTIKNTRITKVSGSCGASTCGNSVIRVTGPYTVTISHVEIRTGPGVNVEHGIRNSFGGQINVDHVLQASDIDALCWCGNANLQDNYSSIHLAIANDHLENLYLDGHTVTANHNTFINNQPQTANIFANVNNGSGGACSNKLTVTNNLLSGGGWSIYPCGNGTSQGSSTTVITGNRFARCGSGNEVQGGGGTWFCPGGPDQSGYFPRGGSFGVVAAYYPNMVWSGNYWNDNLKTFCPDRNLGCP